LPGKGHDISRPTKARERVVLAAFIFVV